MRRVGLIVSLALLAGIVPRASYAASVDDDPCINSIDKANARLSEIIAELKAENAYQLANGGRLSPAMERQFIRWYVVEQSRPGSLLPSLQETAPTPAQLRLRTQAVERFHKDWTARMKAEGKAAFDDANRTCASQ